MASRDSAVHTSILLRFISVWGVRTMKKTIKIFLMC